MRWRPVAPFVQPAPRIHQAERQQPIQRIAQWLCLQLASRKGSQDIKWLAMLGSQQHQKERLAFALAQAFPRLTVDVGVKIDDLPMLTPQFCQPNRKLHGDVIICCAVM